MAFPLSLAILNMASPRSECLEFCCATSQLLTRKDLLTKGKFDSRLVIGARSHLQLSRPALLRRLTNRALITLGVSRFVQFFWECSLRGRSRLAPSALGSSVGAPDNIAYSRPGSLASRIVVPSDRNLSRGAFGFLFLLPPPPPPWFNFFFSKLVSVRNRQRISLPIRKRSFSWQPVARPSCFALTRAVCLSDKQAVCDALLENAGCPETA